MTETTNAANFEALVKAFDGVRLKVPSLRTEKLSGRADRLHRLRKWIRSNRKAIHEAMYADLKKPAVETDVIEVFHVLSEIRHALTNLEVWARPKKVDAPLTMLGTRAHVRYEPRGACLILSPWNYPFALAVGPLVSALAAGNSVIIKPSELTPSVSALIARMAKEAFDKEIVTVREGGPEVARHLLSLPFDHIFFTGSPAIGKQVMKAAADHLTSVTLELGGKSPSVVTASASVREAARRTAVAKFVNNGQTCVAPDYVLVDEKIAPDFIGHLVEETKNLFAVNGNFEASPSYCRIVNERHFHRVSALLNEAVQGGARVCLGGENDLASRFIHPVILTDIPDRARLLEEEIFGPILPVIPYRTLDDAIQFINDKPKALALYIFSRKNTSIDRILRETSSGGVCINDSGLHFLHHNLPFGGVNNSGIGKSHGHYGFLAFSNEKAVLKQKSGLTTVRPFYPPYGERAAKLVDWFLKLF